MPEVSAGGYRAWRIRQQGQRAALPGKRLPDALLLAHIRAAFAASKQTYGWPRIWRQLRAQGLRAGKERVRKTMRRHGVRVRPRRRFRVTTDSSHNLPVAANLLRPEFTADAPNTAWVGDITYVWTAEGWLYLAMVIDLSDRQAVGFAMGERMSARLAVDAPRMAWLRRKPGRDLIVSVVFRPRL